MPIEVTTNFEPGDFRFTDREVMREIGLLARETIVRRTARGIAADGAPFQPYSAAYTRRKAKELGRASPVNLSVSGGMLGALQIVEVTETTVTLGFG